MAKATVASDGYFLFWCPGCAGAHAINVAPGGWTWNQSLDSPTTQPSILVRSGHYSDGNTAECWCTYEARYGEPAPFKCGLCHSYITNGHIQFLSDCTHALAGQTVELPEWEEAYKS